MVVWKKILAFSDESCTTSLEDLIPDDGTIVSNYALGQELTSYENAWELDIERDHGTEYLALVREGDSLLISQVCDPESGNECSYGTGLTEDSRSVDFVETLPFTKIN